MQTIITSLDKDEVLRYLGYQGTDLPDRLDALIDRCIQSTLETIEPAFRYRRFHITKSDEGIRLEGTQVLLTGQAIQEHLGNCGELYLLCATIGLSIEKTIRLKMLTAPDEGVIFDSCATTAVEKLADYAGRLITKESAGEGLNLTWRFSPGYGDLPLETQQDILTAMDTHRRMGLSLNQSLILTPGKSITAIIGLSDTKRDTRAQKCDFCNNREYCAYRKRGTKC